MEVADRRPRQVAESHRPWPEQSGRKTLRLLLEEGGPGFCQFALNNACNARCGFCGFALDKLPRESWQYVEREGALEAIDILYREAVRYLVLTGGEPMLHPDLLEIVQYAGNLGMKVLLVTNAGLLKPHRIRELGAAGLSSFIISIDAADAETHERNRGLPGVCGAYAKPMPSSTSSACTRPHR